MFLLICTIVLIICAVKYIFRDKDLYSFADKIPGPRAFAVIGSSHKFLKKNEQERFEIMSKVYVKYQEHKLVKFWLGPSLFIFVNEPDLIEQVLKSPKCLDKSFFYKFFRLDKGLLSLKYDTWEIHRKFLEPSFHSNIVGEFMSTFNDSVELMRDSCENNEDDKVDILKVTSKCALTMILSTSFGITTTEVHFSDEILKAVEELSKIISNRCREPIMYIEPVYRLTRSYYREKKYRKRCYSYLDRVLRERRDFIAPSTNNNNNNNNNNSSSMDFSAAASTSSTNKQQQKVAAVGDEEMGVINIDQKNFIDQLIYSNTHKFTDEEIHDHIYTFIAAGYEKIALQSAHTLLMLAMHENEQEKLYQEICEMNLTTGKLEKSALDGMKYLDAVVKESMRLLPAVPMVGREVTEEFHLGDLKVPKNVTMIINFFQLHRRDELWGVDASKFIPDRFLQSDNNYLDFRFLPFSEGSRDCIGKHYAMLALKVIIVDFTRNFKIQTDLKYDELKFKSDVTLKLCQKLMVKIVKR